MKNWSLPTIVPVELVFDLTFFFEWSSTLISQTVLTKKICVLDLVPAHFLEPLGLKILKPMLHVLHHRFIVCRLNCLK